MEDEGGCPPRWLHARRELVVGLGESHRVESAPSTKPSTSQVCFVGSGSRARSRGERNHGGEG